VRSFQTTLDVSLHLCRPLYYMNIRPSQPPLWTAQRCNTYLTIHSLRFIRLEVSYIDPNAYSTCLSYLISITLATPFFLDPHVESDRQMAPPVEVSQLSIFSGVRQQSCDQWIALSTTGLAPQEMVLWFFWRRDSVILNRRPRWWSEEHLTSVIFQTFGMFAF